MQPPGDERCFDALGGNHHDRLPAQVRRRKHLLFAAIAIRGGKWNRHFECRTGAGLALQRDAAAHSLDDALRDAQAKTRTAVASRDALVGLLELAENARLGLGRDADAGVAHQERDFMGSDPRLDNQRHAAG